MFKVSYNKLSEAFEDYKGGYKEELKALPDEVWDALDEYLDEEETHDLTQFFEELWVNGLFITDANEVDDLDEGCFDVLYVDEENNTAYLLQ